MKVYRYGLKAPTVNADWVRRAISIAHDYRNDLVQLERERRRRMRELDTLATEQLRAQVVEARAAVESAVEEMRRERARLRKRSTPAAMREAVKLAKSELKQANMAWRAARELARADEGAQARRDEINEWWLAARRRLRPGFASRDQSEGVSAGTYQLVEDADAKARADLALWDNDQPSDPRFLRWTGEGAVSQQIVGGVSVEEMFRSRQIGVDPREDRRDPGSRRSQLKQRVMLRLRVGSNSDRSPVWAEFPMVMHRPLPAGGIIKRLTVHLRTIGPREEWCAQFVVDEPKPAMTCGSGGVGIDIGWRIRGDSLRVAVTCDEHGAQREISLPPEIIGGLRKVEDLRSIRDTNFNAARDALLASLTGGGVPDWMRERTATLHQWRSPARLAALALRWREAGVAESDEQAFEPLEQWRQQDRHLWLWETSQRSGSLRRRKDFYRNVAADLARRYGFAVLEEFDLRKVAVRDRDADKGENEVARSNRHLVALSEFRDCLRNAFASRGGKVVEVPAHDTTRTCAECGELVTFDQAGELRARCSNGHEWDQDENAARNILERWSGEPDPDTARSDGQETESRRERVRRKRAEKLARMDLSKSTSEGTDATEVA